MEKPAYDGGQPVRDTPLHYGHQYIDEEDIAAVTAVLRSDFLTCGPKIDELERRLCEITGAKYAVVCSNGTAALHLACQVAGIGPGDEVITTPLTFAASANCALYCGGRPVFADIDEETYNIDPAAVEAVMTPQTKAVVAVDYTGQAAQLDRLQALCRENGWVLIEDAAHSIGTSYQGHLVGSIADMTTFSFHPVKTVTGGEGGAVLTNDEGYYQQLLLYRSHGITRNETLYQHSAHGGWYYEQLTLGNNYRMTDIQAALLISQLNKLPLFAARRKAITARYDAAFAGLNGVVCQKEIAQSDTVRHLYVIRIAQGELTIGRREFFEALAAEKIMCNVHYIPVYFHPFYEKLGYVRGLCPVAERVYEGIISLPLYYGMTDRDVEDVITAVTKLANYYRA
ncbi:MAG: UDP-4-amino-4,6-dideoxy-N-acetyl-beta-L-altrosamine transaminase [Lachnospiraceae bacterium]|nr:UDP-4-amino-4,6-dideoxy-N-acetyl-beta-L-altrosamine transaminase [Lachnospiraceae bacterium]